MTGVHLPKHAPALGRKCITYLQGTPALFIAAGLCAQDIPNPVEPTSIPLKHRSGRVHLPVSINGSEPHFFLLDTGYSINMINPELAETLQLQPSGGVDIIGIAGRERADVYRGVVLDLGGVSYRPRRVAALPSQRNRRDRSGILSSDFFRRFVVVIRPKEGRVLLHDPASFDYKGDGEVLPLEFDGGTPVIQAAFQPANQTPVKVRVEIDTGCDGALCLSSQLLEEHPQLALEEPGRRSRRFGVGGNASTTLRAMPALKLGKLEVESLQANIFESDSLVGEGLAGHIGFDLLRPYNLIFDYRRSRMILEPLSDSTSER